MYIRILVNLSKTYLKSIYVLYIYIQEKRRELAYFFGNNNYYYIYLKVKSPTVANLKDVIEHLPSYPIFSITCVTMRTRLRKRPPASINVSSAIAPIPMKAALEHIH